MGFIKDLLHLKWFKGFRTKIIGFGLILTSAGMVATHLASVIGGEASLDTLDWQAVLLQFSTGAGLLAAVAHKE